MVAAAASLTSGSCRVHGHLPRRRQLAQRLVRRVCEYCKTPARVLDIEAEAYSLEMNESPPGRLPEDFPTLEYRTNRGLAMKTE